MEQRIIKFKAKCIADGEWAKGYYFKKPSYKKTSNGDIVEDGEVYCIYGMTKDDVHPYWYEVDPSTVCQFTGLVDMNGKEIWEHDFIGDSYSHSFEVIWLKGAFVYRFESGIVCLTSASTKEGVLEYAVNYGSKLDRKEGKQ